MSTTTTTPAAETYTPAADRYERVPEGWHRRCGRSGIKLPAISLGCWHNFGGEADHENCRRMLFTAFDQGITHFDLANNYGPPPGSAEHRTGRILKEMPRDELIVSTKAGFLMWPGPYGEWGSRKNLLASLDQSLQRLDLDYVDLYYHHRPDPDTPIEETMDALDTAVKQGKALYAGISNYSAIQTQEAADYVQRADRARLLIHQANYNLLNRWIEDGLTDVADKAGLGIIAFCPLAQGQLTDKYLGGVPADSRAGRAGNFLKKEHITQDTLDKVAKLNEHAQQRGQSLAQMALAWVLRDPRVTSALIGASKPEQIVENVQAMENASFTEDELKKLDAIVAGEYL